MPAPTIDGPEPGKESEISGRTPEEHHKVIPDTSSDKTVSLGGGGGHLKYLYTNSYCIGNK